MYDLDRLNLLLQAEDLADLILKAPEVEAYRSAEAALQNHPEATSLIRRLRDLREQVAEFQARKVPPMHYAYLLEETEKIRDQMDMIPELKEYENAQQRMETLLDSITSRLSSAVQQQLDLEHPTP